MGKSLTASRATWVKLILMGVNKDMDMGGSGVIVRKSMESFVAVSYAKELGLQKVILVGDSKLVIDMLK